MSPPVVPTNAAGGPCQPCPRHRSRRLPRATHGSRPAGTDRGAQPPSRATLAPPPRPPDPTLPGTRHPGAPWLGRRTGRPALAVVSLAATATLPSAVSGGRGGVGAGRGVRVHSSALPAIRGRPTGSGSG